MSATDIFRELLAKGCFGALALIATALVGSYLLAMLRAEARRALRLGVLSSLPVLALVVGLTIHASTKRENAFLAEAIRLTREAPVMPLSVVDESPADAPPVTELRFTAIRRMVDGVLIDAAWPSTMNLWGDWIFLLGSSDLRDPTWHGLAALDASGASGFASYFVPQGSLPAALRGNKALFRLKAIEAASVPSEDEDDDDLPDEVEEMIGTDLYSADSDGDGIDDAEELRLGLNPLKADTDGDGIPDGEELSAGSDPSSCDTDGDGLSDFDEVLSGTAADRADSDDDGLSDLEEVKTGSDPLRPGPWPDFTSLPGIPEMDCYYTLSGCNRYDDVDGSTDEGVAPPSLADIEYARVWSPEFLRTASGLTFRPLATGRFFFKLREVDDRATVGIGNHYFTSEWHREGSELPSINPILIAGRDYPVSVVHTNKGGVASLLLDERCGEFTPIERPAVAGGFTREWILCEEYAGHPNRWNEFTVLEVHARGGELGARIRFRTTNLDRLEIVDCDPLPEGEIAIPANQERMWRVVYRGVTPSRTVGDVRVVTEVVENETGERLETVSSLTVTRAALYADYDRINGIDQDDRELRFKGRKLRHWLNNDADSGVIAGDDADNPLGAGGNLDNANIDGLHDLVDFTPVCIELGGLLELLGDDLADYRLKIGHEQEGVNGVWTDLTPETAHEFLISPEVVFGSEGNAGLLAAPVFAINAAGVPIPDEVLTRISTNGCKGVLLIEGAQVTRRPLTLTFSRKSEPNRVLFTEELPMQISEVKDMMRWVNVRPCSGEQPTPELISKLGDPFNLPDEETSGRQLVFLHGANVTQPRSFGWCSEVFKRLWQSGSKASFVGVSWRSNIGSDANYHENASNAFEVAAILAPIIKRLSGEKVMMAHSLGNMVVSSMIHDYDLPVEKYIMCNSAVPSEAYYPKDDISIRVPQLVHPEWEEYPTNCWASNWHKLFRNDAEDGRKELGWPGRFLKVLPYAVNFYSTGDEVLELRENNQIHIWTGMGSGWHQYSWHHQELWKGRGIGNWLGATTWSGWNIEENLLGINKISVAEARAMDERDPAEFKTNTVFYCYPESMNSPEIPLLVRAAHLTHGIPALAPPAGGVALSNITQPVASYDMNNYQIPESDSRMGGEMNEAAFMRPNGWPQRRGWGSRWLHSDIKDIPYYYTSEVYELMVEEGGLR